MFESVDLHPLQSPIEVKQAFPLSQELEQAIGRSRKTIEKILNRQTGQLLFVVGPCSIHHYDEAIEYANRLNRIAKESSDLFQIVMRVNFEKPRTYMGWKGILHDPDLAGTQNLQKGIFLVRKLMLEIASIGLPIAAELLDPWISYYVGDLLSWGWIGSRTSESQIHRQLASGLSFPVGFKNSTDGSVESAVYGAKSASIAHSFLGVNEKGKISAVSTKGNPHTHMILRGGKYGPNYDLESQTKAVHLLNAFQLPERLIIDCSHDNSRGDPKMQSIVFKSVVDQIQSGNPWIRGLMLESYLQEGRQERAEKYGISITDACIGWKETEDLILAARKELEKVLYQLT